MRVIFNKLFSVFFFLLNSNQFVSAILLIESEQNYVDFNFNNIIQLKSYFEEELPFSKIHPSIAEDARLDTPGLITKYGYKAETHYVTTEDGYILQLHRITGGPTSPPRHGKKVCFYMHGSLDSSAGVVLSGPTNALAFILADNGYDVWLGNARGNIYSANHTIYKAFGSRKHQRKFWNFSWHEIGLYDLPASIDYILSKTDQSELHYIGHSQGTSTFFVMLSERPEYNNKIKMMHALAPAAFLSHCKSPLIRAIVPYISTIRRLKDLIGSDYIVPEKWLRNFVGEQICGDSMPTQILCKNLLFMLMGYNSDQLNSTLLPVYLGHTPAGSSTNQLIHFGQLVRSGHFRKFDFGWIGNILKYKSRTPPDYNLKNVRIPVAIYYSQNDLLANVKDVHILLQTLPNVVKSYLIPHKEFNHIDFLVGIDAPILLYYELLQTLKASYF